MLNRRLEMIFRSLNMNTEKYLYYCIYLLIATPLVITVEKALLKTFSHIQTLAICMILAFGVYYLVCHVLKGIFEKVSR